MTALTPANQLTLLRMLLIPAFVILVVYGELGWALIVFVTAAADIALQAPPGEVAVVAPNQVADLKDALTQAHIRALARRQTWRP